MLNLRVPVCARLRGFPQFRGYGIRPREQAVGPRPDRLVRGVVEVVRVAAIWVVVERPPERDLRRLDG